MINHIHCHHRDNKTYQLDFDKRKLFNSLAVFTLLLGVFSQTYAFTLNEAEDIALNNDPLIESHQAEARAWTNNAVADNQLPDPKLRFGMYNLPLDSFDASQEPTTQLRLGVQQAFPKGDSLELKQLQSEWYASAELARSMDRKRDVLRNVRKDFFNLYYQVEALRIIRASKKLFSQLVDITEAHYAAGRVNQQDVLRADLELSRLDDRAIKIKTEEEVLRARLSQWLGEVAWQPVSQNYPELSILDEDINSLITKHPSIEIETAKLEASKQNVAISQQQYKLGWGLGLEYRKRFGENPDSSDRTDMMAAMVTLDIPLFTEKRQDKRVAASEEKMLSVRLVRDDKLRKLKRLYESNYSKLTGLTERQKRYKNDLLKSAKNNASAALKAYQSGVTEFTSLMRAHMTELDIRLSDLRIRVDRSLALTQLLYVTGEK